MRFEKSEYSVAEEDTTVEITVLTDRPVSRSFSVSLRFEHNSTQGEPCSVLIIRSYTVSVLILACTCTYAIRKYTFMCLPTVVNKYVCSKLE